MAGKHTTIADALIEDILSGHYRVGERLPSERDLAARFAANRGAVREAMKQLEQMGLASIQPGGARVNAIQQASLDVVGRLMYRDELPDAELLNQILTVISALTAIAAEGALKNGSEQDIEHIRSLVKPLMQADMKPEEHQAARFALMEAIMLTSGNLICQLIARTLFEQFEPSIDPLRPYARDQLDIETYTQHARRLDAALAAHDIPALRATFEAFSNLNRQSVMQAIEAARLDQNPSSKRKQATN